MRSVLNFLLWAVICYGAIVAFMALTQSRQIFFPTTVLATTPAQHGMTYEDIWLETEDGLRLHAWLIPAPEERGVLLFFHGNAGNISHRIDSIRIFRELGLSVLIVDYRGYGQSEGRPSEQGLYLDALAAWHWLREAHDVPSERIVVFGRSLGSAVAAWLAARERPAAVILESVFTKLPDLGAELMPWLPVRWLLRYDFDTRSAIAKFQSPVIVVHSRQDELMRFAHGEAVFAAAPEPRYLLPIQGGHNDGFIRSRAEYVRGLEDFLDRYLPRPEPAEQRRTVMPAS